MAVKWTSWATIAAVRAYLLCLALCALTRTAQADPVAEQLYQEGKQLLEAGQIDLACDKLGGSYEREKLSGTLITLGYCREQQGKTASAWSDYKQAIVLAQREGREAFVESATRFADAIEPKLSKLTIHYSGNGAVDVSLDGTPLPAASLGTALPVDPGDHQVEASATGFHTWRGSVAVGSSAAQASLSIPPLAPAPVAVPEPLATQPSPAPSERDAPESEGGIPVWAWIVGGVGVVCLGLSAGFIADTVGVGAEIDEACGDDRQTCPPLDEYDFESSFAREERSTAFAAGFGIAAGLGIGAGIIGIALAPSGSPAQASGWRLRVGAANADIGATFGFEL